MDTQSAAYRLLEQLRSSASTVATAESLTGGLLCSALVDVPGTSDCLRGGVITYATDSKAEVLGVDLDLLAGGGPVQAEVAEQMAAGVAAMFRTDLGISTTGVAGPGDSSDGPAGLVFVGAFLDGQVVSKELHLHGSRDEIRCRAVDAALALALSMLGS